MVNKLVQEIDYTKRDWRRDIGINVAAVGFVFAAISSWARELGSITPPIVIVSAILAFIPHELLHALFFKIWGGKIKFGAMWTKFGPALYTSGTGTTFARNRMIAIALAPQILSAVLLIAVQFIGPGAVRSIFILTAVLNFSGGFGDYYCLLQMMKYSKKLQVEDSPSGLRFYMPEEGEL